MLLNQLTDNTTASVIGSTNPDWLDDVEHESWLSRDADNKAYGCKLAIDASKFSSTARAFTSLTTHQEQLVAEARAITQCQVLLGPAQERYLGSSANCQNSQCVAKQTNKWWI